MSEINKGGSSDDFVQCPNCDYICTKADLLKGEELSCPSCGYGYWEGCQTEDQDWTNPKTRELQPMTDEDIHAQLDWQKELHEKGIVQALIDNHLKKPDRQSDGS